MNLTERVGPLPVWAWAGIAVGGLGLGLYERQKNAATAAPAAATSTDPTDLSGVDSTAVTDAASFSPDATTGPSSSNPYGVTSTENIGTLNVTNPTRTVQAAAPAPTPVAAAPAVDGEGKTLAQRQAELNSYEFQLGANEQAIAQADPRNPASAAATKAQQSAVSNIETSIGIVNRQVAALTPQAPTPTLAPRVASQHARPIVLPVAS